ncbi:MAG: hypothetical protein AAB562_04405, partial [Patescibacteria group bacterium]
MRRFPMRRSMGSKGTPRGTRNKNKKIGTLLFAFTILFFASAAGARAADLQSLTANAREGGALLRRAAQEVAQGVRGAVAPRARAVSETVRDGAAAVGGGVRRGAVGAVVAFHGGTSALDNGLDAAAGSVQSTWRDGASFFGNIGGGISRGAQVAAREVRGAASDAGAVARQGANALGRGVSVVAAPVREALGDAGAALQGGAAAVGSGLSVAASAVGETLGDAGAAVGATARGVGRGVSAVIRPVRDTVADSATVAQGAAASISGALERLGFERAGSERVVTETQEPAPSALSLQEREAPKEGPPPVTAPKPPSTTSPSLQPSSPTDGLSVVRNPVSVIPTASAPASSDLRVGDNFSVEAKTGTLVSGGELFLTSGNATLKGLRVTGLVDFSGAQVIGLPTASAPTYSPAPVFTLAVQQNAQLSGSFHGLDVQDVGTIKNLTVSNNATITNNLTVSNTLTVTNGLTVNGTITASSSSGTSTFENLSITGNTRLGDASGDTVEIQGRFTTSLLPAVNNSVDLGAFANAWRDIYASSSLRVGSGAASSTISSSGNITLTGHIFPGSNNASDLGAFGTAFRDIYASSSLRVGSGAASSTISSSGNITLTGHIFPGSNNASDLGAFGTAFRDIY